MSLKLFDLTGRTALITGSSRGLGRAFAEGLAGAGARVILNGVDAARLEAAARDMRAAGHDVLTAGQRYDRFLKALGRRFACGPKLRQEVPEERGHADCASGNKSVRRHRSA